MIHKSVFFFVTMINGITIMICYSKLPSVLGTIPDNAITERNLDQRTSWMPELPWTIKVQVVRKEKDRPEIVE